VSTQVSLRDAAQLLEGLRSPSLNLRRGILRALLQRPEQALALGDFHGWDVIDELIHQSYQECSLPYYRLLLSALASYRDPRVTGLFRKVANLARDPQILEMVGTYLTAWRPEGNEIVPADSDSDENGPPPTPETAAEFKAPSARGRRQRPDERAAVARRRPGV